MGTRKRINTNVVVLYVYTHLAQNANDFEREFFFRRVHLLMQVRLFLLHRTAVSDLRFMIGAFSYNSVIIYYEHIRG